MAKRRSKVTKAPATKQRMARATVKKMLVDLCERLHDDVTLARGLRMHLQAKVQQHTEETIKAHGNGGLTPEDFGVVVASAAACRLESHLQSFSLGLAEIIRDGA